MRIILLFLLSLPLMAQTGLVVKQASNTGGAFCYIAADNVTAYSVEVSTSNTYSPVLPDFNGTLFAGAATDLGRTDTTSNASTHERCVQAGHACHYFQANNGARYDRNMPANRTLYVRVNGSATTTLTTDNIQTNIVATCGLPIKAPFVNDKPSLNPNYQTSFRDAITGQEVRSLPGIFGLAWAGYTGSGGRTLGGAGGTNWSATSGTAPSALALNDNVYAQTSTQNAKLFVSIGDSDKTIIIAAATAANPMVLTLATPAPDLLYVNAPISIGLAPNNSNTGCSQILGTQTVTAVSGTSVTINVNGTTGGCSYIANSARVTFAVIPVSSSFQSALSYMNLLLRADCTGCGSSLRMSTCHTSNGNATSPDCDSETKTVAVSSTEGTIRICQPHDHGSACATAEGPGDLWTYDLPNTVDFAMAHGRVWNGTSGGCSAGTMLCFTSVSECSLQRINNRLNFQQGNAGVKPFVVDTNCGASPPSITMDDAYLADANGATGIPYLTYSGTTDNYGNGFLFWEPDAAAGTLRIDQVLWVAASYSPVDGIAHGAGGFPPRCQENSLRTAQGRLFCAGANGIWTFKDVAGDIEPNYMGYNYTFLPGIGAEALLWTPETFTWSTTEVGVLDVVATASSGNSPYTGARKKYLVKVTFNNPDIACGAMGTTCTLPAIGNDQVQGAWDATYLNLTPCLNSCSTTADDYTLEGQILRFQPTYDYARFGGAGLIGVQGNFGILRANELSADSWGAYFAFDFGNGGIPGSTYVGSDGNTQQVYRYNPTYATFGCRWCGDHTPSPALGTDAFTVIEAGAKAVYSDTLNTALSACSLTVDCAACPGSVMTPLVINGYSYIGQLRCTPAVTVSSAYPGGGQTQPGWWVSGDPVNNGHCQADICNNFYKVLQTLEPGDRIVYPFGANTQDPNYEILQVVTKVINVSDETFVFERGCGTDQSYAHPKSHSANIEWSTFPVATNPICSEDDLAHFPLGQSWDWIGNRTYWNGFVNHTITWSEGRVNGGYGTQLSNLRIWANVIQNTPSSLPSGFGTFAGVVGGPVSPDCVEYHPAHQNYAAASDSDTYIDAHPLSCTDVGVTITNVTGDLYSYGSASYVVSPKLFPLGAWLGALPFRRTNAIDGTSAHWGEWCANPLANGCFSGSSANVIYANGPILAASSCVALEFWLGQMDSCDALSLLISAAASAQHKLPPTTTPGLTSKNFRRLTSDVQYRASATANVKYVPDGKYFFQRNIYGGGVSYYVPVPVWPTDDGLDRLTFIPRAITIPSGSVPGSTSKARLKGGYDERFACNENSDEACHVVSATVNASVPFLWTSELSSSDGVSCASGCTIEFPQIEGRIARYQVEFIDAMGMSTGTLPVSFDLGSAPPPVGTGGSVRGGKGVSGGKRVSQ